MAMRPFDRLFRQRRLSLTQFLQVSVVTCLALILTLHSFRRPPCFDVTSTTDQALRYVLSPRITPLALAFTWCLVVSIVFYASTRPRPAFLLDYSCFRPPHDRRCAFEVSEYFLRRTRRFSTESEEFMRGIYNKSGLGDETYAPPFVFQPGYEPNHSSVAQEAEEGMFGSVDALLAKTRVPVSLIDTLVVSSGAFSPSPSLASVLVNRYGFHASVKTYNIAGMGCVAGSLSVDLAARILSSSRRVRYVLVVAMESISLNWYFGADRSMLVSNCIFRVGCAASLLTNDPTRRWQAKLELVRTLRTHRGADDASYLAAFQTEDEDGNMGMSLKKDLVRVASEGLKEHIRSLGIQVLPLSQLLLYAYNRAAWWITGETWRPSVPDFKTAFEHMCIHTGGKAVIDSVDRSLRLGEDVTEPARMTLHRFGNTSSSLVFYELAYFEAKGKLKKGDRLWMLAFGTGFKISTVVLKSLRDSPAMDPDNPWDGCVHRYPLKAW